MTNSNDVQEDFARLLAMQDKHNGKLQSGQKVNGTVIAIGKDAVFVDVGVKEDGVLDIKDIGDAESANLQVGDKIEAYVVGISSQGIKLSRSMSGAGIFALEQARDLQLPVQGKVKAACKGGYQVEAMGKIAFCPGSQIGADKDANDIIGQQLVFLITRIENNGRNIVVSRRALLDKEREENLEKFMNTIKPGDIVEGKVSRMAPYGVFVELAPSLEGMVHLSELSWNRIDNPLDAVSPGDIVSVKLLEIGKDDKNRLRISLSRKQASGDPWLDVDDKFRQDSVVKGKVRRLAPFGVFVELAPGIEGLVYISELSWERVRHPEEIFKPGDEIDVKIKEINKEEKRISLSARDAQGDPWADVESRFAQGSKHIGTVESKIPYGLFITLAPGLTGLLPDGAIKNAENSRELAKLNSGDKINIIIQNLDCSAKRISLIPESSENTLEDNSWREHTISSSSSHSEASGIMAQALQKALHKKNKGDKA